MSRSPLVSLVLLLSFLPIAAHALQFFPATPIGQSGYPAVTAVAVSESAPHVVYAAAGGSLFRSTDAGATWTALPAPASTFAHLAVDPANSAIVYFVALGQVFRSDDSGATWRDVSASGESAIPVRIDPGNPSTIYLGARCSSYTSPLEGGGVYKSADRGETWVRLGTKVQCVNVLSYDPAAPERLFAGTAAGANYRTDDGGRMWREVSGELPVFDVAVDPLDASRRYGLGRGPAGDGFVHFVVSTDAGATWTRVPAEGLPPGGQQLVIDPATRRLFLLGQSFGLYVSDDLGLRWRHIGAVPVLSATPLTMAAADDVIYVATPRGLYRVPMSDPDSPTAIHPAEPAPLRVLVDRIALDPRDAGTLYATAYEGPGALNAYRVFRSTDSGRSWHRITGEEDTERRVLLAVDASGDLYGLSTGIVWRFARDTQTWERWDVPLVFYPTIFVANPQRAGWLYAASAGWAAHSTDGGRTWVRMSSVPSGFWSLSIAPNGSDMVGGSNEGAFASNDGGVTWRALPGARLETRAVAVAPSRPETIYRLSNTAAGGLLAGLFRSDDGGETWMALRWPGERDTAMATTSIAVDPRDHRSLWIGLAHSSDGGVTWTIEPSSAAVPMYSVVFDRDGAVLYGLGRDLSIWKTIVRGGRRRAARP